jgi:Flp pilus assembly protein TadG
MSSLTSRRGAQAIEFGLLLPVLMMIVSAIVDYGWYFNQRELFVTAVRDGARTGAVTKPTSTATYCGAAKDRVNAALTASYFTTGTQVAASTSGVAPDRKITVTAKRDFNKLIGLAPTPARFRLTVVMRLENQTGADCTISF